MAEDEKCPVCGHVAPEGAVCNRAVCGFLRLVRVRAPGQDFYMEIQPNVHRARAAARLEAE